MAQPKRDDDREPISIRRRPSGVRRAQRASERADVAIAVTVRYGDGTVVEGIARNLSLGGAYVEALPPAPFGSAVILHLPLPGFSEPAPIDAIVRWNAETGMGVQFGLMGARLTHALTEMLRAETAPSGGEPRLR